MSNIGTAIVGQVLSGNGSGSSPSFSAIGTNSGLTNNAVLLAKNINAFSVVTPGADGQVLTLAAGVPSWATPTTGTVTSVLGTTNRITSTGGATPVIDISASYVGQSSITTLGTVATGTWQGTIVGATYGGTGVNNGSSMITLGGSLTTSGAFATTFTMTGATNVTFPTSGTLSTTTGTVTSVSGTASRITSTGGTTPVIDISASYVGQSSITTLGTISTGVWNGTTVDVAHGGTGVASQPAYSLVCGGTTTTGAFQSVADVAVGQVLVSGGTAALPAFSATPSVTSITLGGGTALANYVQGTWTPAIAFGGASVGITYSTQLGFYTRVGNVVNISGHLVLTSKGSSTGVTTITGLPVTPSTNAAHFSVSVLYNQFLNTGGFDLNSILFTNGSTTGQLWASANGSSAASTQTTNSNFANNTEILFTGFYLVV